jgi:hypothetical protein
MIVWLVFLLQLGTACIQVLTFRQNTLAEEFCGLPQCPGNFLHFNYATTCHNISFQIFSISSLMADLPFGIT